MEDLSTDGWKTQFTPDRLREISDEKMQARLSEVIESYMRRIYRMACESARQQLDRCQLSIPKRSVNFTFYDQDSVVKRLCEALEKRQFKTTVESGSGDDLILHVSWSRGE